MNFVVLIKNAYVIQHQKDEGSFFIILIQRLVYSQ